MEMLFGGSQFGYTLLGSGLKKAGSKIWGATKWAAKDLFSGLGWDSWVVDKSVKMPFEWLQTTTSGASAAAEGGAEALLPLLLQF